MARSDKLAETHERLTRAVEELVSGDDWRAMLDVASRFHAYSPNNCLLILSQRPDATRVAGYRAWQKLGRQVRRGERAIGVLAPVVTRRRDLDEAELADHPELARVLRGFTVAHVFDISQTEGPELPEVRPQLLAGHAPDALWETLADRVRSAGFNLLRADCAPANGRTHFQSRTVVVREDLAPAQATKTLAHELAHVLLHDGSEYALGCRGRAEVEAESVAYLVCVTAGLDAGAYTFPYLAHWSPDQATVRDAAERVITCARRILVAAGLEADTENAA